MSLMFQANGNIQQMVFKKRSCLLSIFIQQIRKQRIAVNRLCVGVHKGEVCHCEQAVIE